ncbi:MAG: hypothetical protein P8Q97_09795 [Myxococcota bacterium]|nr:hypothetical protein [Myxococcota bacterium]
MARRFPDHPRDWKRIAERKFGNFITEIELLDDLGRHILWNARRHRKGLGPLSQNRISRAQTFTQHLNGPIAGLFIVGASLFIIGSLLSLLVSTPEISPGRVFFAGSIFFTAAASVQYLQSINNSENLHLKKNDQHWVFWAWQPGRIDFWVTGTQLLGAVCFNFNTFDGLRELSRDGHLAAVWLPNFVGSILFMVSGYLSVVEFNTRIILWPRKSLQSVITLLNFWGCVAFMISALLALVGVVSPGGISGNLSLTLTAIGAGGFLSASVLMLFEK